MSRLQTATLPEMFASHLTRRMALRYAAVAGGNALLERSGISPVAAQDGTPAATAVTDYPEVVVAAADFSFNLPASIPGGLTRLTMQNAGAVDHHAMFMRLNDNTTLDDFTEALTTPDIGRLFALAASLGGPEVGPGGQATTIAHLTQGQYMVICLIPDEAGTPHYMMGMYTPLEVTAPVAASTPPTADQTVKLVDFAFEMSQMAITAGPQVWEVPNAGAQVHEMVIMHLASGFTADQALAIFATLPEPGTPAAAEPMASPPAAGGPPPIALIGGVAPMNPGFTNWAVLDLPPGDYLAICFVPDPATGQPHFALGMVMPFTVS